MGELLRRWGRGGGGIGRWRSWLWRWLMLVVVVAVVVVVLSAVMMVVDVVVLAVPEPSAVEGVKAEPVQTCNRMPVVMVAMEERAVVVDKEVVVEVEQVAQPLEFGKLRHP